MNIGLFFGSFNPIHTGHLIIANTVVQCDDIDQVWFIISPQNPFKKSGNLLNEIDRLRMVEAAIEDNFDLRASDVEFRMPKPSYTADTLAYLTDKHPTHKFKVIVGQDNLKNFSRWKNHEVILNQHGLIVYPRPGASPSGLTELPTVSVIEAPLLDISATFIRSSIAGNKSIRYLVPDPVIELIQARKYYQ
ncbi:nicotinate (nicotinamide) nucleotide adenylyltransferase [Roseivirga sp. BDSF3-8]|uniref:nicotinate (nicotinamide) nucleotide adenylyltransferase n=1 Tax=Roseivirga sp. BDSF3-8 TaxID=3241598 RepID=UPI003531FE4D